MKLKLEFYFLAKLGVRKVGVAANSSKLGKLGLAKFKVRKVRVRILMHPQQNHTQLFYKCLCHAPC